MMFPLLARDPRSPQDSRHRQRDPRARRPEGPPQAHRLIRRPTGALRAIVYRGGLVLAALLLWLTDLGDTS